MTLPIEPYLAILRTELATTLYREDDENARRTATFCHRIISSLLAERDTLPKLHQQALARLDAILDDLCGELRVIDGGAVLTVELAQRIRIRPDYRAVEPFLQEAAGLLAGSSSAAAKKLLQDISDITFDIHRGFYDATRGADFTPAKEKAPDTGLDEAQKAALQTYLRQQFPSDSQVEVGSVKLVVGGGSKQTLIVALNNCRELPDTVVVRVDKAEGVVGTSVTNEYFLIELMYQAGVPGPKPYALETGTSVLGAPFIIVSKVEGHNIGDWIYITEPSRDFAVELAHALARMHSVPLAAVGDRLSGAHTSVRERMEKDIASFERTWRSLRQPSVGMEQAYAWLKKHIGYSEGRKAVIHCDVGCHNMLGENGHLTAILDWETAVVGNPAQDLAYARTTVVQMMPWEDFLLEYEKAGGVIPHRTELDFYELWRCVFQIHWLYIARSYVLSGLSSAVVHAYGSQRLYQHMDWDLHRVVKDLYERY